MGFRMHGVMEILSTARLADLTISTMKNKILVVEDNALLQKVVGIVCAHFKISVDIVGSCMAAMHTLERSMNYKIVFLDNRLPDGTGCTCARAIRELERNTDHRLAIIAMTGDVDERAAYFEAGMNDCLAKPFTAAEFRQMVERWSFNPGTSIGGGRTLHSK